MIPSHIDSPARQLRHILKLLNDSGERLAKEWETSENDVEALSNHTQTTRAEHDAVRVMLACFGSLQSLISSPYMYLSTLSMTYVISRALHVAADHNIADHLARGGVNGISAAQLAQLTSVEEGKLCRIMRTLVSHHIFSEVEEGRFANNHVSQVLVDDPGFRAFVVSRGRVHYAASDFLPSILVNPATSQSYDPTKTAVQQATGTKLSLFPWLNEMVDETDTSWRPPCVRKHPCETDSTPPTPLSALEIHGSNAVSRPEKQLFGLAMAGLGKTTGQYVVHDFPWDQLKDGATVVDVGGGIGSFCMDLLAINPTLNLIVQDQGPVIDHANMVWNARHPDLISRGQVKLQVHDFFGPNPVIGAEVYFLRYIVHDWPDSQSIQILSCLADSMTEQSRVLIAEILMKTTIASDEVQSAPSPLLANYGHAASFAHMMDINIMMMNNGMERTPGHFRRIIEAAGLELEGIYETRSPLSIIVCRKPSNM